MIFGGDVRWVRLVNTKIRFAALSLAPFLYNNLNETSLPLQHFDKQQLSGLALWAKDIQCRSRWICHALPKIH